MSAQQFPRLAFSKQAGYQIEQAASGSPWVIVEIAEGKKTPHLYLGAKWSHLEGAALIEAGYWVETFEHLPAKAHTPIVSTAREDRERVVYFTCPRCGGECFGRDTAADTEGNIIALESVRCHDEREVGCRWRGIWPLNEHSPKIDHELAAMRKALEARN